MTLRRHSPLAWWRHLSLLLASVLTLITGMAHADVPLGSTLVSDQSIQTAHYLESTNKKYRAYLWPDGNFTVDDITAKPWKRLWATGPSPHGSRVVMQGDGNLCKYGSVAGQSSWCSYSHYGNGPYFLILRDFGALEIYQGMPAKAREAKLVWTSRLDPGYYVNQYPDLKQAFGNDGRKLMEHWIAYGQYEGRSPNPTVSDEGRRNALSVNLDTRFYADRYPDLKQAFGYDAQRLYEHWMNHGRAEGRVPSKSIEDFLAPPPRSAHRQSVMRVGDWLREGEFMASPNGYWQLHMQQDGQLAMYERAPGPHSFRWGQSKRGFPHGQYFSILQPDGHMCTYRGTGPADNKGFIGCTPEGAGGPNGRYFAAVQDDGNLAIYKGGGPADNRGWIWDRITTKPSSKNIFEQAAESVATWTVGAANTVARGTTSAANTVASGTTQAANELARETVNAANVVARETTNAANVVARETVNTANKVANTTEKVAVQVGRKVEQGGKIIGTEIVRNGEIVGYAVANFAVDVWNTLKGNCGTIGRKVFPIDGYFQGAKQITGALSSAGAFNGDARAASNAANQCFEDVQDGFYCSFPAEIEKLVSQAGSMPGNLINLGTRVFNEAKSEECLIAGASTAMFGAMGLQVCALGKVVVGDAQKAFACFSAAEAKGVMKKFFTPGAASHGFPSKEACNGIGQLAFTAAMQVATNGLSNEAKAAVKAGKSNTVAIVADQLRSVYKVAAAGARYDAIVSELEAMPECGGSAPPGPSGSAAQDEILAAFYGAEGQPSWSVGGVNVLDRVRSAVQGGAIVVPANMNAFFGGDPLPGRKKLVAVQVRYKGQIINLRQDEGKELRFPGKEGTDYRVVK